ncbi:hypothetical protein PQX77_001880 [Marasmius sp. AFHP31]|nr:hypothetical protein PQX77_001880 [Marasmius sp. AFHP31]
MAGKCRFNDAMGSAPDYLSFLLTVRQDDLFMDHVLGGITWTLQSNTSRTSDPGTAVGGPPSNSLDQTSSETSSPSSSPDAGKALRGRTYDRIHLNEFRIKCIDGGNSINVVVEHPEQFLRTVLAYHIGFQAGWTFMLHLPV